MTTTPFVIGQTVMIRDEGLSPRVVVALPETPASEWLTYGGRTVAGVNPDYPADAATVVVVFAADVSTYLPDWDGETPLTEATLREKGIYYEGLPAPRLTSV
ncbi:hypothetical protein [Halocatena pleomorpha]|uniref:Uncharacterized protein n=1 Tax=Halocatena pleomorpha TaxID=1785090 RepID=A0A3P3RDH6_9EURY|nr:hypothetical protein [Halocatena pleomorpha]RRJ31552.1 hypothetical protein EIK79_07515 [Halocatena pleomorpha]